MTLEQSYQPCRLTERPFAEFARLYPGHWLVEPKYDGERVLVRVGEKVEVTNRYGTTYDFSFLPEYRAEILAACHYELTSPLILDAEFVSLTKPDLYQFLKDRIQEINNTRLMVFDILMNGGIDLRAWKLLDRAKLLSGIVDTNRVQKVPLQIVTTVDQVWKFYEETVKKFEGIVVKPLDSIYKDRAWCKLKKTVTHDVVILAVKKTEAFLRMNSDLGQARSFLIGFIDEEGKTVPYGDVSSGYTNVPSDQLRPTGREDKNYVYVEPEMVVEIMAHSLLETRKFREPRILRTRTDKRATDCKIPDGH